MSMTLTESKHAQNEQAHLKQVCVQLPAYADNTALPAYAHCTLLLLSVM